MRLTNYQNLRLYGFVKEGNINSDALWQFQSPYLWVVLDLKEMINNKSYGI